MPQIQAATLIAQDPGRYGFEVTDSAPLAVEIVSVPASTDLRRLAARTGIASRYPTDAQPRAGTVDHAAR